MKKVKLPVWLICLIFVAATLLFNLRYWLPITAESGERYILTLEDASANNSTIFLDFGKSRSFHLVHAGAFDVRWRMRLSARSMRSSLITGISAATDPITMYTPCPARTGRFT